MSNIEISLKQQNAPYLWSFFCFNFVVFLILFFSLHIQVLIDNFKTIYTIKTLSICIAPLILFIVNGVLSSNQKAILVFWRFKNVLPGNRAFSFHVHQDHRINVNNLSQLHPNFPIDPKEQNRLWYKLYRSNTTEITVNKSHKDFLLARDLTSMSFLFLLLIGIPSIILTNHNYKWYYFLMLFTQYLIMIRIAQNHGRSLVRNVLAAESVKSNH